MQQVIFGARSLLVFDATRYYPLIGAYPGNANEDVVKVLTRTPGDFSDFYVELENAPGSGNSITFTVMRNGNPTSLAVTISGTGTTGSDTSSTISCNITDAFSVRTTYTGSPSTNYVRHSILFTSDYAKQSLILFGGLGFAGTSYTNYGNIFSHGRNWSQFEDPFQQIIPTSGKLSFFAIELATAPGAGKSWFFTLRKNGDDTNLDFIISGTDTYGADNTTEVEVRQGDIITISAVPTGAPAEDTFWGGLRFTADIDHESLVMGGSPDTPGGDEYNFLANRTDKTWASSESNLLCLGQNIILKKLSLYSDGAPGDGTRTLTVRRESNDTALVVNMTGDTEKAYNNFDEISVSNGDSLSVKYNSSGAPSGLALKWSCVAYSGGAGSQAGYVWID